MSNLDLILENVHLRHDPRWSARGLCVACVLELMDREDVSVLRKSAALSGVLELLKIKGVVKDILQQDERVCLHFTSSLLKMLQSVEDPSVVEQVIQVLIHLLLDLKKEHFLQHVLDELQTQLIDRSTGKVLSYITFLGKLVDSVSSIAQMLTTTHISVLECMCVFLLNPDEVLKAAVYYVLRGVWASETALQSLPQTLRDRVCVLLLNTLAHVCSFQLTINCLGVCVCMCVGLLLLMLRGGDTVCLLMNQNHTSSNEEEEESQCTQLSVKHCSLPLILKRLLLGGDECVQVVSVQCVSAVLTHSPSQYCSAFTQADLPEFLFERLSCTNEVLLWSVYSCLLQLCEDSTFFSQCHSIYGIESLVRSLKAVLKLPNLEVQKQGLKLLTAILERQPTGVRLFPTAPGFVGVAEVVQGGVASSCFRVSTQAARAATALFRVHHQCSPVHYVELKRTVEALTTRCAEVPSNITSQRRRWVSDPGSQSFRAAAFLIQALTGFQQACRLAEECVTETSVKENTPTAPDEQNQDTLESLCVCLLHCCDTAIIPTVTFSLSPSVLPAFATKLASSGFIRLALEHKARLCPGNRHSSLNAACCDFLLKLCVCLLSQPESVTGSHQQGVEEVEYVLRGCLPSLCCHACDWPLVLAEVPAENQTLQFCLLHLLYLSLLHGDRLLPDATLFSSVVRFVYLMQEQHNSLPPSVQQSALYLLAATQENNPDLDWVSLNSISEALSSAALSSPHPSLLHFIFRYSALTERLGVRVLSGWLAGELEPAVSGEKEHNRLDLGQSQESSVVLELLEKNPSTVLTLLGVLCEEDRSVAGRAVQVLRCYLQAGRCSGSVHSHLLKPALLGLLQRLTCDSSDSSTVPDCVCVVLEVLCLVQKISSAQDDMDNTDFKLLYHVSNLVGKVKSSNAEYLQPALNYLYCCLNLCPAHTADRVVSMLLCNTGVMELLQVLLNLSHSSSHSPPSPSPPLICSSLLLLSSLISLQHTHCAQVQKSVCLELDSIVRVLTFNKRNTNSLVLVCMVRLVQAVLDVDLSSPVVCVSECAGLQRPLQSADGALHPLGYRGATSLLTALQSLLLQKQELLLSASVNCLRSLMDFIYRRKPAIAQHMVNQPWNRFLLYSLLNSGEILVLHPSTISLLTLLVHWSGGITQWESDVNCVCEAAERKGVKELGKNSTHSLRLLLTECIVFSLSEQLKVRVSSLLECLDEQPPQETNPSSSIQIGALSICSEDFRVNTNTFPQ
ncbi:meiosis inhibitor protein 1 isoform X3 [Astyanax mexicanus]|uniref:meiosis inhibitor protein 1 isoform X3 n=1 Tax=Astyanax mexicanus TaxID=7994 RepID=UPI0020CAF4F3|nr:meiosis inhibitor protein 1 isoform X3 [Astyanax mexicanus]